MEKDLMEYNNRNENNDNISTNFMYCDKSTNTSIYSTNVYDDLGIRNAIFSNNDTDVQNFPTSFNDIEDGLDKYHPNLYKDDISEFNKSVKTEDNNFDEDLQSENNPEIIDNTCKDVVIYSNIHPLVEDIINVLNNRKIIEDTIISNNFNELHSLNDNAIDKCNPFHTAIAMLDKSESSNKVKEVSEIIDYFISKGCDVNRLDDNHQTPLILSLKLGCIDIFNKLIQNKANIFTLDNIGDSLLHIACNKGYFNVIKDLINLDKNIIYLRNNLNQTIFHYGVWKNNFDVVGLIIDMNINDKEFFNYKDNNGFTALFIAAGHERFIMFKNLIKMNVFDISDRDYDGNTILHIACKKNTLKTVDYIINTLKFDVNVTNDNQHTALDLAIAICGPNSNIVDLFNANDNVEVISNKRIKTIRNNNMTLSKMTFKEDILKLKQLLTDRSIVLAFILSMTLTDHTRKYWKPYKYTVKGDVIVEKLSKYIIFDDYEYLFEYSNYENVNHNGSWLYRLCLYQLQLGFFRHLNLTQSHFHSTILQLEFQVDQYHQKVNCYNPIYKTTSSILTILNHDCTRIFDQFHESDQYNQILRVFNTALDHIEKNPNELIPNEVNQYFQKD